ncbi:MAG TPA: nucleotidyltransferase family protein [Thermaerobacter sp.]
MDGELGAVILAGRRNTGALQEVHGAAWEALIPLAGRPMVAWVASACLAAPSLGHVVLVGPDPCGADAELAQARAAGRLGVVEPGDDLLGSVRHGLAGLQAALPGAAGVVLVTGDVPLIDGAMLERFLQAIPAGADVGYPIARRERMEERFPGAVRTYVRLRDGEFTGGNALYLRLAAAPRALQWAEALYAARKQPWKLAMMFGPVVLMRVLARQATVAELERRLGRLAGLRAHAVEVADPELAMDVDKAADYRQAEARLRQAAGSSAGGGGTGGAGGGGAEGTGAAAEPPPAGRPGGGPGRG